MSEFNAAAAAAMQKKVEAFVDGITNAVGEGRLSRAQADAEVVKYKLELGQALAAAPEAQARPRLTAVSDDPLATEAAAIRAEQEAATQRAADIRLVMEARGLPVSESSGLSDAEVVSLYEKHLADEADRAEANSIAKALEVAGVSSMEELDAQIRGGGVS